MGEEPSQKQVVWKQMVMLKKPDLYAGKKEENWTGVQGLVQIAIVGSRRGDSRAHARVTTDEMQV